MCQINGKKSGRWATGDRGHLYTLVRASAPRTDSEAAVQFGRDVNTVAAQRLWLRPLAYQRRIQFLIHNETIFHWLARSRGHIFFGGEHDLGLASASHRPCQANKRASQVSVGQPVLLLLPKPCLSKRLAPDSGREQATSGFGFGWILINLATTWRPCETLCQWDLRCSITEGEVI